MTNSNRVFTDVQFMTAQQKTQVLKAWVRFLKGGCKLEQFSKALYDHLIQHCSFIAHYNRHGFYSVYFDSGAEPLRKFLHQFDGRGDCMSTEYGMSYWHKGEYADINQAMIEEAAPFIDKLLAAGNAAEKASDLALAHSLLAKHGAR